MAKRALLVIPLLLSTLSLIAETRVVSSGGTITFTANALHARSTMISYKGILGVNLGSVSFSTGALMSGSVEAGGTFAEGGSFVIVGNGNNGVPKGVIFSGRFTGPVVWTLLTSGDGKHSYSLTGTVQSTKGTRAGTSIQLTTSVGLGYFHAKARLSGGNANLNP
jgi:hypothetical protein